MSRTNIDIDDTLIAECMSRFGLPTKQSAVDFALRRLLTSSASDAAWESVRGIGWDADLEAVAGSERWAT